MTRPPSRSHACQFAGSASLRLHTPISPRSGTTSSAKGEGSACTPHARCSAFNQCWAVADASLCTRSRGSATAVCGGAGAIQARQGIGNVNGQRGARGQLCVQFTQQAGQRCAGYRWRMIDGGEAGCQPVPVALFGGAAQCGRVQPRCHDRPRRGERGRAGQRWPRQQQGQRGQQQQAHQQQRPIIKADALARPDLCAQPAQRSEIQRRIRMAPGEVDQQRQQPGGQRRQAQREQQVHAPLPRPNSACSGWSSG
ncbi:hypothetical protein G6F68_012338 [Rhizopus microsporus]|nr:hypothetical protein G6F68_012338 [Rhizopus microsporus]